MPGNYRVNGGGGGSGGHYGYPNYGYGQHEMTEYYPAYGTHGGGGGGRGHKSASYNAHHQPPPPQYAPQHYQQQQQQHHYQQRSSAPPMSSQSQHKNGRAAMAAAPPEDDDDEYDRGEWGSKMEFILSCVGFSVGIGNVWRFPYLAYQNGGAAFLFPYIVLLIFVGKPMYYMETAMGQFSKASPVRLWNCAPIGKGVGFGMMVLSLIVAIYYNVIMAYSLVYMVSSITGIFKELPWTVCDPSWGANENCVVTHNNSDVAFLKLKRCRPAQNITTNCTTKETSTTQFWERGVLEITPGLDDFGAMGGFNWDLPFALFISWVIVFLCLMKGVKSSGKVVYFTATFPYVILLALLIRGLTLEGAFKGLKFLFVPDFQKLTNLDPWRKAAEQMFFSLGISWGGLITFGSYNKFHNKIHIDASIVSILDFATSLIASIVVFSVLGFLSTKLDVDIEHVADKGQGLAFIVYPEALSRLPLPWLWATLFFFMLFLLGLDSEFAFLETVLGVLYDGVPVLRKWKVPVTFVACLACFILGLPCVSYNGQYYLDIMDTYASGFAVLWVGMWEVIFLMWVYGFKNVCRDISLMIGSPPSKFWHFCWVFTSPIFLIVIFLISVINWSEHKYSEVIPYPDWATGLGWFLVFLSAVQVPLWAVITSVYYLSKGRLGDVIRPTPEWGPGDKAVRRAILDEQAGITRTGKYSYDNDAMPHHNYM